MIRWFIGRAGLVSILAVLGASSSGCATRIAASKEARHYDSSYGSQEISGLARGAVSEMRSFQEDVESSAPGFRPLLAHASEPTQAPRSSPTESPTEPSKSSTEPRTPKRLVIYRGMFQLEVSEPEEAALSFLELVEGLGGHLERRSSQNLICRVPARHFKATTEFAKQLGRVLDEVVEATDVTRQHRDLEIRLDNALRSRDRLLAILERAQKVEDILRIESELRRLTEEIETFQATLRTLNDQVAFSTIELRLAPTRSIEVQRRRSASRFPWINAVSPSHLYRNF